MDEVERTFPDAFEGKFESTKAYVEYILSERGIYEALEDALQVIPEDVRGYISIDEEQLAHDWEIEMYVVESQEGGVLVFDPRV
jgi:antirestriction protein